jgi:hypothetical protein
MKEGHFCHVFQLMCAHTFWGQLHDPLGLGQTATKLTELASHLRHASMHETAFGRTAYRAPYISEPSGGLIHLVYLQPRIRITLYVGQYANDTNSPSLHLQPVWEAAEQGHSSLGMQPLIRQ